jgi:hypothetical protein
VQHASDLARGVVAAIGHREHGCRVLAEQVRVHQVVARRAPSALIDRPADRLQNPRVHAPHGAGSTPYRSRLVVAVSRPYAGHRASQVGVIAIPAFCCGPPGSPPGLTKERPMNNDPKPAGPDQEAEFDAGCGEPRDGTDVTVESPEDGPSDLDPAAEAEKRLAALHSMRDDRNRRTDGVLTIHYTTRDVDADVDGATAIRLMVLWQNPQLRRDQIDARWFSAELDIAAVDLSQVLGFRWRPTISLDRDDPHRLTVDSWR